MRLRESGECNYVKRPICQPQFINGGLKKEFHFPAEINTIDAGGGSFVILKNFSSIIYGEVPRLFVCSMCCTPESPLPLNPGRDSDSKIAEILRPLQWHRSSLLSLILPVGDGVTEKLPSRCKI